MRCTSPSSGLDEQVRELAQRLAADDAALGDEAVQALLAAAVRRYAARRATGEPLPAWPPAADVPATDVVVTVMAMLEAADVAVFELGMWQALGRG